MEYCQTLRNTRIRIKHPADKLLHLDKKIPIKAEMYRLTGGSLWIGLPESRIREPVHGTIGRIGLPLFWIHIGL